MVPDSPYLRSLFAQPLPATTKHHLVFTFERKAASFGSSNDHTVTVASQLDEHAQRDASRLYGMNETHMSILEDEHMAALLNSLLGEINQVKQTQR
jgi:hypothetical protein